METLLLLVFTVESLGSLDSHPSQRDYLAKLTLIQKTNILTLEIDGKYRKGRLNYSWGT